MLQAAETAIREVVGKSSMDFVLYEGRAEVAARAHKLMQEILDRYGTGISISKVTMQNAQPPEQVQAAFDDAVRASQDRERQKNEGQAYANDVIPKARGAAARLQEESEGYRQRVIEQAEGDARALPPGRCRSTTRRRRSRATGCTSKRIQQILSNTSKVLVDQKGGNNLLVSAARQAHAGDGHAGHRSAETAGNDAAAGADHGTQPRSVPQPRKGGALMQRNVGPILVGHRRSAHHRFARAVRGRSAAERDRLQARRSRAHRQGAGAVRRRSRCSTTCAISIRAY